MTAPSWRDGAQEPRREARDYRGLHPDRDYSPMDPDPAWPTRASVGIGSGELDEGRISFRGRGPKNYRRPDERILEEIVERFTDDEELDATEIEIRVEDGRATLSGSVPSRQMQRRAEDIAEAVSGVVEVRDLLRVDRS